jgi:hypothetical protein
MEHDLAVAVDQLEDTRLLKVERPDVALDVARTFSMPRYARPSEPRTGRIRRWTESVSSFSTGMPHSSPGKVKRLCS